MVGVSSDPVHGASLYPGSVYGLGIRCIIGNRYLSPDLHAGQLHSAVFRFFPTSKKLMSTRLNTLSSYLQTAGSKTKISLSKNSDDHLTYTQSHRRTDSQIYRPVRHAGETDR